MTLVSSLRITLASLALFSSLATAQTRFCLGGNLGSLSEAEQAACRGQLQALRKTVGSLPESGDWHIVLVCGEQGWREYQDFTGVADTHLTAASYDMNLGRHEIFLRSSQLSLSRPADALQRLRELAVAGSNGPSAIVGE